MGEKYLAYDPSGDASAWGLGRDEAYTESDIPTGPVNKAPPVSQGMGGSTPHPALSARIGRAEEVFKAHPPKPVERHLTPEELMALADAMEYKIKAEGAANLARGPSVRNDEPAPWLTQYMEKQPFTDPYHQVPITPEESVKGNKYYKDDAERKKYLDYIKKHKKK